MKIEDIIQSYIGLELSAFIFVSRKRDSTSTLQENGHRIPIDEEKGATYTALSPTRFAKDWRLFDFVLNDDGSVVYVTRERAFRYWPVPV